MRTKLTIVTFTEKEARQRKDFLYTSAFKPERKRKYLIFVVVVVVVENISCIDDIVIIVVIICIVLLLLDPKIFLK